jgi:tRNA(adenine34) deaminase
MPPCPFPKRFPSELRRDDEYFMTLAYNQAIEAWKADEVPVGAVIARGDEVIAAAHNRVEALKDPTAHAEVLAITAAAAVIGDWRLNQCVLYVTKEPCPMCSGAALMARLGRVVYAAPDPKMGFLGGALAVHEVPTLNHRMQVTRGVMEADCARLLQAFFQMKRQPPEPPRD